LASSNRCQGISDQQFALLGRLSIPETIRKQVPDPILQPASPSTLSSVPLNSFVALWKNRTR